MNLSQFIPTYNTADFQKSSGQVAWKSPSNLAIVKYWGKHGNQLPRNPSLSITLSEAVTNTKISFDFDRGRPSMELDFLFEGKENIAFKTRVENFLNSISTYLPFLTHSRLEINSENSFPHSSGIASSASSMSALALCLCAIENQLQRSLIDSSFFNRKASFISRLGSGSACRSVCPYFGLWGSLDGDSSDIYAVPIEEFHADFLTLRNDILIVSRSEKAVSSTAGHKLMENNIYAAKRFDQAYKRTVDLMSILANGNIELFGEMLESEALTLHALMMASSPSYMLIEPNTVNVINEIRQFRKERGVPVYFSLDAGPNVHIISFSKDRNDVNSLLESLKEFAVDGKILNDRIGKGASKIK